MSPLAACCAPWICPLLPYLSCLGPRSRDHYRMILLCLEVFAARRLEPEVSPLPVGGAEGHRVSHKREGCRAMQGAAAWLQGWWCSLAGAMLLTRLLQSCRSGHQPFYTFIPATSPHMPASAYPQMDRSGLGASAAPNSSQPCVPPMW